MGVVNRLQIVDIEEQHRAIVAVALATADPVFQAFDEQPAVGEAGQRVMISAQLHSCEINFERVNLAF